jgi:ABC-2 type transport system permease protein
MSAVVSRYVIPMTAVVRRDLQLAWSYRLQFVTGLFTDFFSLALFYYISRLVRVKEFSPDEYFAYVAIGVVVFTIITATLLVPQTTIRQDLVAGTFERNLLAPRGSTIATVSTLVYPALYALFTMTAVVFIAAGIFGLDLHWSTVPLAFPIAILGLLAFAPFGILLVSSVVLFKRAPPGANYVIAGLALVAGLYFPATLLPGWIEWASQVQPLTPAAELLRNTLTGQALSEDAWVFVAKLVGFAAIALPVSVIALRAAMQAARKRGTILEY